MRKRTIIMLLGILWSSVSIAQFGQFGTGVYLSTDGGANTELYKLSGFVYGTTSFQGQNLGVFEEQSGALLLDGGRILSWKGDNGNFCGGTLYYDIYPTGNRQVDFTSQVGIGYAGNCPTGFISPESCGGNDQVWNTEGALYDLTQLVPGDYTLELYVAFTGSATTTFNCDETGFDNNGGANYTATFSIVSGGGPASVSASYASNPGTNGLEASLDDEVVELLLQGATFINADTSTILLSGTAISAGVSIESVQGLSDSVALVNLAWDGTDYDTDRTLAFTVEGTAYGDTTDLVTSLNLPATVEPKYTAMLEDSTSSYLNPITIIFDDEDPVNDFYTQNQDTIFMEIALEVNSVDWQYQQYLQREYTGGPILLDGQNDDLVLVKQPDGSYRTTFDPVDMFGAVAEGEVVGGINILFFNQYHTDSNTNNVTEVFFLDLVDVTYQTTYLTPAVPNDSTPFVLTFDARGTALAGADKVYLHSGVGTTGLGTSSFDYTVGNWGQDDGVGEMYRPDTSVDVWEISIPNITSYYGLPIQENAFTLNYLFRSADGTTKVDNGGANYQAELDPGNFFLVSADPDFAQVLDTIAIAAGSNTAVTWQLYEVVDSTLVFLDSLPSDANATFYQVLYEARTYNYRLFADYGSEVRYKDFSAEAYSAPVNAPRPVGTLPGINYIDSTTVTLVLHTPTATNYSKDGVNVTGSNTTAEKGVVHLIGDFNNWTVSEAYRLNKDGDYWWITLSGLSPGQDYVFQYLVDGSIRIADPYANQISDFDDQYIPSSVYPNLPAYPFGQTQYRASVINTIQPEYVWEVSNFTPVSINDFNIYEMHFRDFTEEGTYSAATDRLDYIKELGINAIHVMPVSEFEGNNSWGYNPNFYFAADKAYGTPNDLKRFIDEAHKRGIAVFNDIVLNHAFGSNVMGRLYWDEANNRPAGDNPWFNAEHRAVYDQAGHWGIDWNHESEHTQAFVDSVLGYWLTEFNFDGYRFDFTKGFTQTAPDPNDPWASSFDTDRQTILFRMVNAMKTVKPSAVAIFEHLAEPAEDKVFADAGVLMWSGVGHHNQIKALNLGYSADDRDIYSTGVYNSSQWNFNFANLISYPESHDEERQAYEVLNYGDVVKDIADPAAQLAMAVDRLKGGLALNLMMPGPRMLWQFEELAYDYSINYNGRTGEKPVRWDYADDPSRWGLYRLTSQLLQTRIDRSWYATTVDYGNIGLGTGLEPRRMMLNDGTDNYLLVLSNADPRNGQTASFDYPKQGTWYINTGDSTFYNFEFTVDGGNVNSGFGLQAGETVVISTVPLLLPSADDDNDGVKNLYDLCPNTSTDSAVDADGCPTGPVDSVQSQTITFNPLDTVSYSTPIVNLPAVSSAGLTIQYTSSDSSVAFVNGTSLFINGVGSATITANQAGNDTVAAATPVAQVLYVVPGDVTVAANAIVKAVGNSDPPLTYNVTQGSIRNRDSFSGSLSRDSGESIGTYAITQGSLSGGINYNLSFVGNTFTIVADADTNQTLVFGLDSCEGTTTNSQDGSVVATIFGNPSRIAGYVQQGMAFDGVDDYVDLGNGTVAAYDSTFTIAMWLKTNQSAPYCHLAGRSPQNGTFSLLTSLNEGVPTMYLGGAPNPGPYAATTNVSDGNWHHIAFVFDGGSLTFYVDGSVDNTVTGLGMPAGNATANFTLGIRTDIPSNFQYAGAMDLVYLSNQALDQSGITGLASVATNPVSCVVGAVTPSVYYAMDDCFSTNLTESIGGATTGTLFNTTEVVNGYHNQAIELDGSTGYADLNDTGWTSGAGDAVSYSLWVYPEDTVSDYQTLLFRETSGFGPIVQLHRGRPAVFLGGLNQPGPYVSHATLPRNTWSQVTVTYANGRLDIYVNGNVVRTVSGLTGTLNFGSGSHWVGRRSDFANRYLFDGKIDEVRMFDQVLNADEVAQEYTRLAFSPASCTSPPVGMWQFDACASAVAVDSAGASDGALVGATRGAGYHGAGMVFDGVNDYVNLGTSSALELTGNFSAAMWLYPTANRAFATLMTKNRQGNSFAYYLQLNQGVPNIFLGGTIGRGFGAGQAIPLNTWSHVAYTFKNGTLTIYVNGVVAATYSNISGAMAANPGTETWLGMRADFGNRYQYAGSMDEVQVYDFALESSDVAALAALAQNASDCGGSRAFLTFDGSAHPTDQFLVYPNPTEGAVTLEWSLPTEKVGEVRVTSLMGQTLYRAELGANTTHHSVIWDRTPEAGLYLVTITTGNRRYVQRLTIR